MEINIIHFSEPDLKSSAIKHRAAPLLSLYIWRGRCRLSGRLYLILKASLSSQLLELALLIIRWSQRMRQNQYMQYATTYRPTHIVLASWVMKEICTPGKKYKKERCLKTKKNISKLLSIPIHDFSVSSLKCRVAFIDCSLCPICFATTHNGELCWWQRDTMWPWPELELGRLNIRTRENRNEPWRMLLQPPKAHQIAVEWGPGSSDTTFAMSIKCYGSLLTGTQGDKG